MSDFERKRHILFCKVRLILNVLRFLKLQNKLPKTVTLKTGLAFSESNIFFNKEFHLLAEKMSSEATKYLFRNFRSDDFRENFARNKVLLTFCNFKCIRPEPSIIYSQIFSENFSWHQRGTFQTKPEFFNIKKNFETFYHSSKTDKLRLSFKTRFEEKK